MRASVTVALVFAAGCFGPNIAEGLVCGEGDECPPGQACDLTTDRCTASLTDAGAGCWAWEPAFVDSCEIPPPGGELVLDATGTYTIDTDAMTLAEPGGAISDLDGVPLAGGLLISVDRLIVGSGATIRVRGATGLIVAADTTITISGGLDLSSRGAADPGAGANPTACEGPGATPGGSAGVGAGGGGGAGFQGLGGDGGDGTVSGGIGGAKVVTPSRLRGGCPGADGGVGTGGAAAGGAGGGAIALLAQESVSIAGVVQAGGGGGAGATDDGGGGGGGSGGLIALDAPSVILSSGFDPATLVANGGGGGGGARANVGGDPGEDAVDKRANEVALGGDGASGANGGNGSAGGSLDGRPGIDAGDGAGGGGGGAGYVLIHSETYDEDGAVSPPAVEI